MTSAKETAAKARTQYAFVRENWGKLSTIVVGVFVVGVAVGHLFW